MRYSLLAFFLFSVSALFSQNPKAIWKPLGSFTIHKQTGDYHAPGLGVMRTVDVSAKNPNRIIMGGMSSGVWLSNDKGATWKNVTASLPVENIKKIEIAPSDNKIVYAATTVGIIKSVDGGSNWQFTSLNMKDKRKEINNFMATKAGTVFSLEYILNNFRFFKISQFPLSLGSMACGLL
jgi:hypothetical protein